jgi:predicted enzyme related to lactoylglutathione lyase
MPVMDIPNGPTIALFRDPAGNRIGLVGEPTGEVQGSSKGDGAPLNWFEIHGGPFEAQCSFYEDLFGWKISKNQTPEFSYGEIANPSTEYGTAGAISTASSRPSGITLWAQVDDCQKYLEKAEALGGTIDMQPQKVTDSMTVANFVDPQGNRVGVFQPG